MNSLQQRKRDLLVESAINRQVLLLETARFRQAASWISPELLEGKWNVIAPAAGVLLAWSLRGKLLSGALAVLRKLWKGFLGGKPTRQK